MPWIALRASSLERVDITQFEEPRTELRNGDYICQLCGETLHIQGAHKRHGDMVRAHFYHARDCNARYDAHPESPEHLWAKNYLAQHLRQEYQLLQVEQPIVEFEVPIEMPWRAKGRQADVLVTWPLGWRVAHEIQLSPITPDELEERTHDYGQAAIDVVWYLGKRANTDINRDWCLHTFGHVLVMQHYNTEVWDYMS
ncbi:MAG: competence protein CoiA family protein [Chloroflexota bacterium]